MRLLRSASRLMYPTRMEFRKAINVSTTLTNEHLTPELYLHLITMDSPYRHLNKKYRFPNPHWGFYWPGSQALSRYILDNPDMFFGKYIVDIGSGCGACAIAAALSGAATVIANDPDAVACEVISMNSSRNHTRLHIVNKDFTAYGYTRVPDIVLVGDVFYASAFGYFVHHFLRGCRDDGVERILIGAETLHEYMAYELEPVEEYAVELENNALTMACVWEM